MNHTPFTSDCAPLMEACTLALYEKNIFRITGLPVDATAKEISRHGQKLQMLGEMDGLAKANKAAFSRILHPTNDEIRDALARMKEPEHRIVDELFWFWPERFGESRNDPAIQAILAGDADRAADIWGEREEEGSDVAKHNLAVMYHMSAVDWTRYQTKAAIDTQRTEKIKEYWQESMDRWEDLIEADGIWTMLKERVRSFEDEAITTGFVRRIQHTLPQALDRVNAEAALKLAELGLMDWAEFHVNLMNETHQGIDDVEATAELVLGPTRRRLEQHLASVKDLARKTPAKGVELSTEIMDRCSPLMAIYDLFHGEEAHQRGDLFDEVAKTVADMLVGYQKATNDNHSFVDLLKRAMTFATGDGIRERINRNLAIGRGNIRSQALKPFHDTLEALNSSNSTPTQKLQRIREHILPQVPGFASQSGLDRTTHREMLDALAVTLRGISIDAHNDHKDFTTAEAAIQLALGIVDDSALKERLEKDSVELANSKRNSMCYFCGITLADESSTFRFAMHGDVVRLFRRVEYRKCTVAIPCCKSCKTKQDRSTNSGCFAWVAAIVVGMMVGASNGDEGWIAGGVIGFFLGWIASAIVPSIMTSQSRLRDPRQFPEVKRMMASGWYPGEKPS